MKPLARISTASAFFSFMFLFTAIFSPACAATPEEFYRRALALEDIHPFAATCQSAHETGFWTSALWKKARNGAGLKADKNWIKAGRPVLERNSQEIVKGKAVYRISKFRSYTNLQEFLHDYRAKIVRDYPLASKHSDTMFGYFASLQKGRYGSWATSQKYFEHMTEKAVRLAPKLLGAEWRIQLMQEYREARKRGLLTQNQIQAVERRFAKAGITLK